MLKVNDAAQDSLELETLNLELNGEDDYYDALNSGNEDDIFPTTMSTFDIEDSTNIRTESEFTQTENSVS